MKQTIGIIWREFSIDILYSFSGKILHSELLPKFYLFHFNLILTVTLVDVYRPKHNNILICRILWKYRMN